MMFHWPASQFHHAVLMLKLCIIFSVYFHHLQAILDICELKCSMFHTNSMAQSHIEILPSAPSYLSFLFNITVHLTSCDPMIHRDHLEKVQSFCFKKLNEASLRKSDNFLCFCLQRFMAFLLVLHFHRSKLIINKWSDKLGY